MADAFLWDQPSFRFPRQRPALRNSFFFLSLFFSFFFLRLVGFEPRDKKQFERLPFTSFIAFFFYPRPPPSPPPSSSVFHGRIDFFYARTLATRKRFARETRDARLTRYVSNQFSFAGICLLSASACLAALCRRYLRVSRLPLAFTFARLVAGLDFQRKRVGETRKYREFVGGPEFGIREFEKICEKFVIRDRSRFESREYSRNRQFKNKILSRDLERNLATQDFCHSEQF